MKKSISSAVALATAITVVCSDCSAKAATLTPSLFAAVVDFAPQNGTGDNLLGPTVGNPVGGNQYRTFAEFDIGSLTSPVASATFTVQMSAIGQSLSLYGKVGDGVPTPAIDYALGTLIGPLTNTASAFQADITTFLNSLIATNPHHWAELQIVWTGGPPTTAAVFNARIQFQPTPIPPAFGLFLGGAGLMGLLARRRKQNWLSSRSPQTRPLPANTRASPNG